MNISTVNSAPTRYTPSPIANQATTETEKPTTKAVSATNESKTSYSGVDLENITPKQTYELAVNLMQSETISFDSYVKLMIIGANQERPPGELENTNLSTKPFNLLKELEDISTGQHQYFSAGTKESREEASNLLQILKGLPQQLEQAEKKAINVQV